VIRDINKHGSDYELLENAKMGMPLVDKVRTMTNSLEEEGDGVGDDDNQGDACSSLPIQEESSCSSHRGGVDGEKVQKKDVIKTIKLSPMKASVHKRTSVNRNEEREGSEDQQVNLTRSGQDMKLRSRSTVRNKINCVIRDSNILNATF
jgi:hypothetical protein